MPLNLNPALTDEQSLCRNLRAVERHLRDDHYVKGFTPGAMVLTGTATHAVIGNRWPVAVLPTAADTGGFVSRLRASEWVSGKLKVTVYFSSSVAGTANFHITIQAGQSKSGSVMTATTLILNDAALVAGPAVMNTRMERTVYSTANVTQEFDLLSFRVLRTGTNPGDLNANPLNIYAMRVEFIPALLEADVR